MMERAYRQANAQVFPVNYSPAKPFPKQQEFLNYQGLEALYGGAGGGGKSQALLMAALQYVHVPNYHAILFRRTFTDLSLPGALLDRAKSWLLGKVKYSDVNKTFVFPSGAKLVFGYLERESDKYRYQSADFQYVGFDEMTQFPKSTCTYLFSRLRRNVDTDVPLRFRGATNPGGIGHDWVKDRYVSRPATADRRFFPAKLKDNPRVDHKSYVRSLGHVDAITRAQLLDGDWDAIDDGLLSFQTILACETGLCLWEHGATSPNRRPEYFIGMDIGRTKDLSVIWVWELLGDVLWTREVKVMEKTAYRKQREEMQERIESLDPVRVCVDKGGIGNQMAEDLEADYPHIVQGVGLSSQNQGKLGKALQILMETGQVRIPQDEAIRIDFRQVKKVDTGAGGIPIIKTERGDTGHADRFWAAALGRMAAGAIDVRELSPGIPGGYTSKYAQG